MLPSTAVTQDEQLASLALGAATQLDRVQRNLDADIDVVRRFADAMQPSPVSMSLCHEPPLLWTR
jgi:hypothetical protein